MNREKNVSLDCKKLLWKSPVELNRERSSAGFQSPCLLWFKATGSLIKDHFICLAYWVLWLSVGWIMPFLPFFPSFHLFFFHLALSFPCVPLWLIFFVGLMDYWAAWHCDFCVNGSSSLGSLLGKIWIQINVWIMLPPGASIKWAMRSASEFGRGSLSLSRVEPHHWVL